MEKIFQLAKINKYSNNTFGLEALSTPIKINPNKYKENILNSFLQETCCQKKSKNKSNFQINSQEKKTDSNAIERKSKYENNNKNTKTNNYTQNITFSGQKIKYKNENNRKYTILNPFKERSSFSSKSILIPTNENQISIIKNQDILNISKIKMKNKSFIFEEISDKKLKRNNTVYIKKHLSKEKNIPKTKNNSNSGNNSNKKKKIDNYINKTRDDNLKDYYYKANKHNIPRSNSSAASRKKNINSEEKPHTNNINSNVNIFNFDMKYNNVPNYFIKNSKIYNPYFNNYIANNLNNEADLGNYNNLISLKHRRIKNNFNKSYNNEFTDIDNSEEREINNTKMKEQIFEQSAIIIQSVYRGCLIRFQINNLLKAYKGIDALSHFFKFYFWKYFRNNLIMKSNILNNEADSKMSISSISCISALFNTNNKNFIFKSFNSKLFKEVHENFFFLNNNKYLETFQDSNSKKVIWNKKKASKKYLIPQNNKNNTYLTNNKEKCLKKIVLNQINNSKINLLKNFLKFYYNGIYLKNFEEVSRKNNVKQKKLMNIIEIKERKYKLILLRKNFYQLHFFGLVKYMEKNRYYLNNGGRLFDIAKLNNINKNTNKFVILKRIRILKKILFTKREFNNKDNKNILKIFFYKFHLLGIFFYMRKELRKRIITKKLFLSEKNNSNIILKDNESKKARIAILKKLINKRSKKLYYICKNTFDKWNLRTKIFSMIAIDKEKKKKRRIKKRNNKKLGTNNSNNPNKNNNINNSNNSNICNNNTNKKCEVSNNSNNKLKLKTNIIKADYFVEHCNSVIFSNKIKINDYHRLNQFVIKINNILTKKFYFFSLICNNSNNKKNENKKEVNKINEEIDFFIEDSSDNSED